MSEFYISASGDDSGPGTFASPWRSLTRLNTAFAAGEVVRNDRVRLRRGDTFYGRLRLPDNINPDLPGWLRVGAYGDQAALPVISGYKVLNIASGWVQHNATTWRIDLSAGGAGTVYTGYDSAQGGGDVGFLNVDGVIYGYRRFNLGALLNQWDYYHSGTTLYVRSSANPTTLAGDIKASVDGDGSNLRSGVELRDLAIIGHGGHGVNAPGRGGSTRCRVIDCELAELGGSTLDGYGDGTVRYGNGIETWVGSRNVHIEGNRIRDCYDVAFTAQGPAEGPHTTFTDITFRRNLMYRNSQSLEFWYSGSGGGYVNCTAEYNTCLFAGYGWGGEVRPESQSRVHILTFGWGSAAADLTLRRNVFYDARSAYRFSSEDPVGMVCSRNVIMQRPGGRMMYQTPHTIEDAEAWAAADGRDQDSQFHILPASADTDISNADVAAALIYLDTSATSTGQFMATPTGVRVMPIHGPWRT